MTKVEFALESFKNIQDLIKFIDQKTSAVLVVAGLLFTGLIELGKDLIFVSYEKASMLGILTFSFGALATISLIVLVYISVVRILKPRLAEHYAENEASIYYFEHIAKLGKEELSLRYTNLDENEMIKYLTDQQYEVSKILRKKTSALQDVFICLFVTVFFMILFVLFRGEL